MIVGLGDFDALARAIFRQEGSLRADGSWITGSVGYRNNNPGNLVYVGQPGAHPATMYDPGMGQNQTYAVFDTLAAGIAATERQLALDASRGLTLAQRLQTWATGNKAAYVANVSGWLGISPDTPLSDLAALNGSFPAFPASQGDSPNFPQVFSYQDAEGGLSTSAKVALGLLAGAVLLLVID